jgi:hypothetical protein
MKSHQSHRTRLLCAEWREGDGLAPRFEPRDPVKQQTRKHLLKSSHVLDFTGPSSRGA